MAQQALGPGTAVPRKRALFGLLDADGWGWASVKAFVWLVIIIFMLGYLPDRAYYLTVGRTVDLGVLVWSPINLCPPTNETLPCPAPVGAVIPWEPSPPELSLPAAAHRRLGPPGRHARSCTSAARTGRPRSRRSTSPRPSGPATSTSGPRARRCPRRGPTRASSSSPAASTSSAARDAAGAPTDDRLRPEPGPQTGAARRRGRPSDDLTLPEARAGAAGGVTPTACCSSAARMPTGRSRRPGRRCSTTTGDLGRVGGRGAARHAAGRRDGRRSSATTCGCTAAATRTARSAPSSAASSASPAAEGLPDNPDEGKLIAWAINNDGEPAGRPHERLRLGRQRRDLPRRRQRRHRPEARALLGGPDDDGDIPEWKHLDVSDLPAAGLAGAPAVVTGPNAILVGGETAPDAILASSVRANTAPQSPFFQLGLVGATVPGLKIEGEIGQQLGYLNAAGVGTVNFIILILDRRGVRPQGADHGRLLAPASVHRVAAPLGSRPRATQPVGSSPSPARRRRAGPAGRPAPRRPSRRPR